jgi:peptidoglycan hydrolase-like protein with peptidoglycan-binding domain
MYRINDSQAAVREIKKYLYVIATRVYPEIGRTTIDGQYDEQTREAVRRFQGIMELPEDGVVDLATFSALAEVYRREQEDFYARDYIVAQTDFPIGIGSKGENVRAIHILLNELAREHAEANEVGTGSFYSQGTAESVRAIQRAYGLKESGEVDKPLFSRMSAELEAIRRRDKNPKQMI